MPRPADMGTTVPVDCLPARNQWHRALPRAVVAGLAGGRGRFRAVGGNAGRLVGDLAPAPGTVLVGGAACYVVGGAVLFACARSARSRLRSMSVILLAGDADSSDRRRYTEWETLVDMLTRADCFRETGEISPVEHEAIWWEVYDRLEVPTRV